MCQRLSPRRVLPIAIFVAAACQGRDRTPAPPMQLTTATPSAAPSVPAAPIVSATSVPSVASNAGASVDSGTVGSPWSELSHPSDSTGRLLLPLVLDDACDEGCNDRFTAFACEPMILQSEAAEGAPVVQHIARNDTVYVADTRVMLLRPGVVIVRQPVDVHATIVGVNSRGGTHHFAVSDTAFLIAPYEGDEWQWWRHGHVETGLRFWPVMSKDDTTGAAAIQLSWPTTAAWVRIEPRHGKAGWWHAASVSSYMQVNSSGDTCPS